MRLAFPHPPLSRSTIATALAVALLNLGATSAAAPAIPEWTPVGPSPAISPESLTNVIGMGDNPAAGALRMVLQSPVDSNILYVGAVNGGVWQTLDGGATWKALGDDLPSLSIGAMAFDQSNPNNLWVGFGKQSSFSSLAGSQTGIVLFDTRTGTWSEPLSPQLKGKDISKIIANGDNIVVGIKTSQSEPGVWEPGVWRSADGGKTFTNQSTVEGRGLPEGNITSLVADPTAPNRMYAAVVTGGVTDGVKGVYRSEDGGDTWTHLPDLPVSQSQVPGERTTYDLMLSISNNGTLVASVIDPIKTEDQPMSVNPQVIVYRSSDHGTSWVDMGSPGSTEILPGGSTVQWGIYSGGQFNLHGALLVDPDDANVVYISGDSQGPFELIGKRPTSIGARVYSGRLFRGTYDPATKQTTWEAITDYYTGNGSGPHADSRFMMIDAAGNLIQTDDGGIYLRTDPKSRNGVWQSLNSNLQTGEVHAATWNPLTHTVVTAMQDNGATIQLKAGDPTHATASGGDGGIAAVNANWQVDGERYAAVYTSSQYLGDVVRNRLDSASNPIKSTDLELGVEKDGEFLQFGEGTGAIKPPRPRKPVTKKQAQAASTEKGTQTVPFYPTFALNNIDPTRLVVGGFDLYIGQDSMVEGDRPVRITTRPLFDAPQHSSGFTALDFGARNNADALLAGTGHQATLGASGALYYTSDVNDTTPVEIHSGKGVQAALFDRDLGTEEIYFSDGTNIYRGAAQTATPYDIESIDGNLPEIFFERRGLDHISNHGVSALAAAGTHNVSGGNWLYTLRGPSSVDAASANWDTRLGRIPNSQIFGLDYSVEDDVLLAYTMGRGAFALYDVTTHFSEATQLVFGQAGNNSQPLDSQLVDGERLDGSPFSRALIKRGTGTLDLAGTTAAYSGGTELRGGLTQVNADVNLGAAGKGVSFDNAALRFTSPFSMNRPISLHAGGGTLDTGSLAIGQGDQPISGAGQLTITGGGSYTLSVDNSHSGGTLIDHAVLVSSRDSQLGAPEGGIRFDAGRLNLLDGYVLGDSGQFTRSLTINLGNGTLDTANNDIPFAGSIDGPGTLNFMGRPLKIAGDVKLNATWNGPMEIGANNTLRGTGHVNGPLTVHGRLYPGNSPGTLTASGPVTQMPGSTFAVDIDGTGTGNGAGNYSRLLVTGTAGTYEAAGQVTPVLRGITGAAHNDYTPEIGQDFTVVQASGGVLGSYSSLIQPADGLLPGSRFDTIYRDQAIQLYITPASYAALDTLGVSSNGNRRRIGATLDETRPVAGQRPATDRKPLFDAMAPLKSGSLGLALDQIGGAAYAPLLWADFDNSKFLASEVMDMAASRRSAGSGAWAYALHRNSRLDADTSGPGYNDALNGVMVGFDRRLGSDSTAGLAFGYAESKPGASQDIGSARVQNWQLMAYGSHRHNQWFVDGTAGFGIGQIAARRSLTLPGLSDTFRTDLKSRNLSLAGRAGWSAGDPAGPLLEAWAGLHYLASRHPSASERSATPSAELRIGSGTLQSLASSLGVESSVPFKAAGVDWRASLNGRISQELLDNRAMVTTTLLGSSMKVEGAATGRTKLEAGIGLRGQLHQRASIRAHISGEMASGWRATTAGVDLRIAW